MDNKVDSLRLLNKGLQVVACELNKDVVEATPNKDPKTIFGHI